MLKPIDPAKGSGKIFYDVVNRGSKGSYTTFNQAAAPSSVANTDASGAGTGLLMRRGYTIVWSGWEDATLIGTGANTLTASLPVAHNADGSADRRQDDHRADLRQRHRHRLRADRTRRPISTRARRTWWCTTTRSSSADRWSTASRCPQSVWSYVNNTTVRINRADPFLAPYDQGAAFEFVYPGEGSDRARARLRGDARPDVVLQARHVGAEPGAQCDPVGARPRRLGERPLPQGLPVLGLQRRRERADRVRRHEPAHFRLALHRVERPLRRRQCDGPQLPAPPEREDGVPVHLRGARQSVHARESTAC